MLIRRTGRGVLGLLAAGYLVWRWSAAHQRNEAQRRLATSAAHPHEVTRWEEEGGALPESGPQLGPEPAHP